VARTTHERFATSIFTKVLTEVLPTLPPEIRLSHAERRLQERLDEMCDLEGLPRQVLDIVASVDKSRAPFPLFQATAAIALRDTWSRLIRPLEPEILGVFENTALEYSDRLPSLLSTADRIEYDASALFSNAYDMTPQLNTPWIEPTLPDRLTRALTYLAHDGTDSEFERLLLIGLVAAVEAGFRTAEAQMLRDNAGTRSIEALLASEPTIRRAIAEGGSHTLALKQWIIHLAAVRECVLCRAGDLTAKICEILRALLSDVALPDFQRTSRYLVNCVQAAFDTAQSTEDLPSAVLEVDLGAGVAAINGRRLSIILRLVWALALDTRIFPLNTGLHVVHEAIAIPETLDLLQYAKWKRVDSLLDLNFWNRSAALDLALRQVVAEVNDQLLLHRHQPNGVLYRARVPLAAAASRLVPEKGSYRLPHITFKVSVSETQSLLMGTNLYRNPALAVRELYQNAVDACHYRSRRIRHALGRNDSDWSPHIDFRLGQEHGRHFLECRDNGVGMSDHELREAFAKTGRRFRDLPEFVEETADWASDGQPEFDPISQFGIGVLSYFMIADEVELLTTRVDRKLLIQTPLHVLVQGSAGLFQVSKAERPEIAGGGTVVRLYLTHDARDFDLAAALHHVIRAPTIPVTFESFSWQPGTLYDDHGQPVNSFFSAPDLGIFFHEGAGELLINGIPTEEKRRRIHGCTVSLGGWAKPILSVDRRSLLDYDRDAVALRLQTAAGRVDPEVGVSANWLLSFFCTDIGAARVAYRKLQNSSVLIRGELHDSKLYGLYDPDDPDDPDERDDWDATSTKTVTIVPAEQGIYSGDPEIIMTARTNSVLGFVRCKQWAEQKCHRLQPGSGLPPFDDRLLSLFASKSKHFTARYISDMEMGGFDFASWCLGFDWTLSQLMDLAEGLRVTLGAAAVYAWAVTFLEQPKTLFLTAQSAGWSPYRTSDKWEELRNSPYVLMPILGNTIQIPQAILLKQRIISASSSQIATELTPLEKTLPAVLADQYPKLLRELVNTRVEYEDKVPAYTVSRLRKVLELLTSPMKEEKEDPWPIRQTAPAELGSAALFAVSYDRDSMAPYYSRRVPAAAVMHAAYNTNEAPEVIARELRGAGMEIVPADVAWPQLMEAARRCPALASGFGSLRLPESLWSLRQLAGLLEVTRWSEVSESLRMFLTAGLEDEVIYRLLELDLPEFGTLRRHVNAIHNVDRLSIDVGTLVDVAVADQSTYGEALSAIRRYAPIAQSWRLPQVLVEDVDSAGPDDIVKEYFSYARKLLNSPRRWALAALWTSITTGATLSGLALRVVPLLVACEEDVSLLTTLIDLLPGAVTFDHLLVVGALQLTPSPCDAAEIAAMCMPFAIEPGALQAKSAALLHVSHLRLTDEIPPSSPPW
jgi:hypothetical protein